MFLFIHHLQVKKFGMFSGEDKYTTKESERLLRLPLYYGLKDNEVKYIVKSINDYFKYSNSKVNSKKNI